MSWVMRTFGAAAAEAYSPYYEANPLVDHLWCLTPHCWIYHPAAVAAVSCGPASADAFAEAAASVADAPETGGAAW